MPSRTVRILCLLVLSLQALMAAASAGGWLLCTHADGTAHVDFRGATDCCQTDAPPTATHDASCAGRPVPLDSQDPKPAVPRGPHGHAVAIEWSTARPFLPRVPAGLRTNAADDPTKPTPRAALAGVVLLT